MLAAFEKEWTGLGLGDAELRELQYHLLINPEAGDVIPGLSGARKLRVPLAGRGKSGGARVIYVDIVVREKIYFLAVYAKNAQENLTSKQKRELSQMVEHIKKKEESFNAEKLL